MGQGAPGGESRPEPAGDGPDHEAPLARTDRAFGTAVSWSMVLTVGRNVTSLVVSLVLARLLGPEAFGIVAMAAVFVLFVEMLVQQGLIPAIVQRPELTRTHLDTAFWMTAAAAAVALVVVVATSGWWAQVNDTPALAPVIVALSLLLPLKGLSVVQEAQIQRDLDFRVLAIRTTVAVVVGGVVGIVSALLGAGVWALVLQQLTTAAIELVLIWRMSTWRPRLRASRTAARELLGFSGLTALASIGVFVERRADALLIGLFFGPVVVGLYRMATRLIDILTTIAAGPLQSTFLPELARFEDDPEARNERTVDILRFGAILALPLLGLLAATSDPLLGLLGEEWAPAAPALRILCVLAATHAIARFTGPILQAAGRPGLFARTTWVTGAVGTAAFVVAGLLATEIAVDAHVSWIAIVRTVTLGLAFFVIVLPAIRRGTGLPGRRILAATAPAALAATIGGGAVLALRSVAEPVWPTIPLVDLVVTGTIAAGLIAACLLLFEPRARDLVARARSGRRAPTRA